ncbi:hypothetical protein R9C00_14260 [Flammeovirgaceae bacterium SG7u.111]|nr:hypothetical protein [Flammeovirgaceae bacterium SG7u.132]WPO38620.1 hypothetical protein R9C00_14260 [Flammeovirgaceae bacterium SG7u.111]
MKHFLAILLFLVAFLPLSFAQTYPLGLNPPSLKWQQINTDKVQVVFQQGQEEKAQRVANLAHYLHDNHLETLGEENGKVTIFLQNQTTVSNGFVALAPFRSEFYMTPPQQSFLGTGDWLDLLAIHEYRHVNQNFNAKKGISKAVTWVFGENGLALMRATAIPRWFSEGDAVVEETALSTAGRGRNPLFDMEYRAVFEQKKFYNYEKASAGSLKDFVPNHYTLGYYMVGNARRLYGKEIWNNVYEDAAKYKGLFYPLSRNLKKHTGLKTKDLYMQTMRSLDSIWSDPVAQPQLSLPLDISTKSTKIVTSYNVPQFLENGDLLVEKSGFNHIRSFVRIDKNGKEEVIIKPGLNNGNNIALSTAKNKIVWAEQTFDVRWGSKDFSVIKIYDLSTKKKKTLTKQSKYFTPALSPDATKIVVAATEASGENALVVLSTETGAVLHKVANPDNYFFSQPKWLEDGKTVVTIAQKDNQQAMLLVNTQTDDYRELLPWGVTQMTYPFPKGDFVYFSGAYTGVNNIFAVRASSGDVYQLTANKIGAYEPTVSADGKDLVFTEFTAKGYKLKKIAVQPAMWPVIDAKQAPAPINFHEELAEQIGGSALENIPDETFSVSKYKQTNGLIYLHSFQPIPFHPNYTAQLQFDNKFSTLSARLGLNYNVNENNTRYFFNLSYGQFFPVLKAGVDFGGERTRGNPYVFEDSNGDPDIAFYNKKWKENDFYAGFTLPFNLTHGNYFSNLSFTALGHFLDVDYQPTGLNFDGTELRRSGSFGAVDLELDYTNLLTRSRRQFHPRWGQMIDVSFKQTVGTTNNEGGTLTANGTFYFPGLLLDHSLFFIGNYKQEGFTDSYKFRDDFTYARGYNQFVPFDQIYRLSANYGFPLIYPDLALGSLAFIKRIRTNLFFDYSSAFLNKMNAADLPSDFNGAVEGETRELTTVNRSAGVELIFDFRALRLIELGAGVRYSYLLDSNSENDQHKIDVILLTVGF